MSSGYWLVVGPDLKHAEIRISSSETSTVGLEPLKKADLEKSKGKKIDRLMTRSAAPGRFGQGATVEVDRREQRKRDRALGLVAFAIKLDGDLVRQLHTLARERATSLNELAAELLQKGLKAK